MLGFSQEDNNLLQSCHRRCLQTCNINVSVCIIDDIIEYALEWVKCSSRISFDDSVFVTMEFRDTVEACFLKLFAFYLFGKINDEE